MAIGAFFPPFIRESANTGNEIKVGKLSVINTIKPEQRACSHAACLLIKMSLVTNSNFFGGVHKMAEQGSLNKSDMGPCGMLSLFPAIMSYHIQK